MTIEAVDRNGGVVWSNSKVAVGTPWWAGTLDEPPARCAMAHVLMTGEPAIIQVDRGGKTMFSSGIYPVAAGIEVIVVNAPVYRRSAGLSPRQVDVVRLMADDLPTRDVAWKLGIAHSTVETHVQNAKARMGFTTNHGLVAHAIREGIV